MAEKIKPDSAADTPWKPLSARLNIDRVAEGGLNPHRPPYGFRVNELGEWEQVPEQVAIIREMAVLRLGNGASYPAIARHLNAQGIPSPQGGAKGWSGATVWRILRHSPYWHRPDLTATDDPWQVFRLAKVAQVTGFLGDEYPPERRAGL